MLNTKDCVAKVNDLL